MNAKQRKLAATGRDRVRYVHLIDEWPEGRGLDHEDAMLQAPERAVIAAIARDRDHYGRLLNEERDKRQEAEAKLVELAFAVPTTARRVRASRSKPRDPHPRNEVETPAPIGDVWHALAVCESGMRQNATSPSGRYLSYFQWSLPTWRSVGGVGDPRTVPYETQVALAKRLQARSGWGQWPACSRKLGLS